MADDVTHTEIDEDTARVARALCERHIRVVRRWDTEPSELEAIMPEAVEHNWSDFVDQARVAIDAYKNRPAGT